MTSPAPPAQALARALEHHQPLVGLLQRVQQSRERLAAVNALLPAGLQGEVRAGPLDDAAWVLLVSNAAAAAKLRQLLPAVTSALQQAGWAAVEVKVKVLPRS
jgi:hypothetical protein